jgi:hypothetical protein
MSFFHHSGHGATCERRNNKCTWEDRSAEGQGGEQCVLSVTENESQMSMVSIAEIGVDAFCVGLELVSELEK